MAKAKTVSLTTFIDFISETGTAKANVVSKYKHNEYEPYKDFYKAIRDLFINLHKGKIQQNHLSAKLRAVISSAPKSRQPHYEEIGKCYLKWLRKNNSTWIDPVHGYWRSGKLTVSINPELGLDISGQPYFLKLYFKKDRLKKDTITSITSLMDTQCRTGAPNGCIMGIFDIRRSKIHPSQGTTQTIKNLLNAEAAYWNTIWPTV